MEEPGLLTPFLRSRRGKVKLAPTSMIKKRPSFKARDIKSKSH